jgi:hypothetical protein
MSVENAPPLSREQERMQRFYNENADRLGLGAIGWGRNYRGAYHGTFAKLAWLAWREARKAPPDRSGAEGSTSSAPK